MRAPRKSMLISFPIIVLVGVYFLGPEPATPNFSLAFPDVPSEAAALERYINDNESKHVIKPDNEARVVWADSSKKKTEYVVVYLHGFSACQKEGDPVHRRFAKTFGANLYLARLADHGVDTTETLLYFTADRFWETSKQALAIGKQLGEKVILVSTSTGGTTALKLAAEYPQDVFALVNLSPNIAINDPAAFLLNNPWGLQIARTVLGGDYRITGADEDHARYWNKKYRIESLPQLEELIEQTMNKQTFERIKQPSLTLYYYRNEENQDPEVKVNRMLEMNEQLGTPADQKAAIAFPKAGAHVIGSDLVSKDVEGVYNAIEKFAVEKLQMVKVNP
jgi:esterase/lipase